MKQRPALGTLFAFLSLAFAGVAFAAGYGAGGEVGRWIVALAAVSVAAFTGSGGGAGRFVVAFAALALAVWLGSMAFAALRR